MKANYHTHTKRCHHAKGVERDYVEAAIKNGFQTLGFSEHTPYPFNEEYCTHMRLGMDELEDYITTVLALKKEYRNDIQLYVGLETEYFPLFFDKLCEQLKQYPLDYMILSAHFFGDGHRKDRHFYRAEDDDNYLRDYFYQLATGMNQANFSYIAHPDILYYTGDYEKWENYMRTLCKIANAKQLPLEINFHGILEKRNYPHEAFWKIAGEEQCQVVFGVDAHDPKELECEPQYEKAMELVKKYNLHLLEELELKKPF